MSLPSTMTAIIGAGNGKADIVTDKPLPEIPDNYVLVKVSHVALNPSDWKHIHDHANPGTMSGCDFAGTIVALGANLARPWTIGTRVAGLVHGAKHGTTHSGCFGTYTLMKSTSGLAVPPNLPSASAATIGVTSVTVGLGLYQMLNLPWPDQSRATRPETILIYGGSTVTGLFAIQLAKLSGWRVIATASKRNWELVRSVGADEVVDYSDADACVAEIRGIVGDGLEYAFDTIGMGSAAGICARALTQVSGRARYVTIAPFYTKVRSDEDLWQKWLFTYTSFGEDFDDLGRKFVGSKENEAFTARWLLEVQRLLEKGSVRLFPIVREGGLREGGILEGLEELRLGKVNGGKLVYSIE